MKTLFIILLCCCLVDGIAWLIYAWVKWSTNKMIDDFCREEHERFKKQRMDRERENDEN